MKKEQYGTRFWASMSRTDMRVLAIAVFFLFSTIGPLSMLMETHLVAGSWFRFILLTVLSGLFSALIILTLRKPILLAAMVIIFSTAFLSTQWIEETVTGASIEKRPIITPEHFFKLNEQELAETRLKHFVFGFVAIGSLAIGYTMFIIVITKANGRRLVLETEISLAQSIQQSLLPKATYNENGIEIAGVTVPATEVGGDYYDCISLPDGQIAIIVADVSGHGVGAGILSAMTKSALYLSLKHHTAPSDVLNDINTTLFQITEKQMFVTCAYVVFNPSSLKAVYATAGHSPLLHHQISGNTLTELRTPNLALGMQQGTVYSEETVSLNRGDALFLFTDGYVEAANPKGDHFGLEKLKELIYTTHRPSAEKLSASLVASVREFTVTHHLKDDITMVVMHIA
jgi:hypothetical protein